MKMASKQQLLDTLRDPAQTAEARAAAAVDLLVPRSGQEAVRAALHFLVNHPTPAARPALRGLYSHYAENGVGRDPGTYLRSQIVRALRAVALPDDVDIFNQAVATYEFPPPAFKEEAALLRGGALVALAEWDETLARYHATRLLADPLTDPMSGQPALVAVDVLATFDEALPLFFYAMQAQDHLLPEIAGECLRRLTSLPAGLLPSVLHHYAECRRPALLVGVIDLLIQRQGGPEGLEFLARLLHQPPDLDLYRYLVAALLAAAKPELYSLLAESARLEQNPAHVAVLVEVLGELADQPEWREVVTALRGRRRPARR